MAFESCDGTRTHTASFEFPQASVNSVITNYVNGWLLITAQNHEIWRTKRFSFTQLALWHCLCELVFGICERIFDIAIFVYKDKYNNSFRWLFSEIIETVMDLFVNCHINQKIKVAHFTGLTFLGIDNRRLMIWHAKHLP